MKIEYTKKLFYRKYMYKLTFLVKGKTTAWHKPPKEANAISSWIQQNQPAADLKIIKRWNNWEDNNAVYHVCVYCKDRSVKDSVLLQFGSQIAEVCQPLDDTHHNSLEIKNIIEIRKSLIYKKYQYAVYFKYDKNNQIYPWLQDYFKDDQNSRVSGNKWWPKLYLTDEGEIVTIKLSWQDRIDYIKTVRCVSGNTP